jgi:hypothetical protein
MPADACFAEELPGEGDASLSKMVVFGAELRFSIICLQATISRISAHHTHLAPPGGLMGCLGVSKGLVTLFDTSSLSPA